MFGNSPQITTNQNGIHDDLPELISKYLANPYQRPITSRFSDSFENFQNHILKHQKPVILDSGCGVGESTMHLGYEHPDHIIIGLDKSAHRLQKAKSACQGQENIYFYHTNVIDFWRLAQASKWPIEMHYILYPNPWPLKKDLKKRFHAHPVFPVLLLLCKNLKIRSNWLIYLQEFAYATRLITDQEFCVTPYHPESVITPFERKYMASGHSLYDLDISIGT